MSEPAAPVPFAEKARKVATVALGVLLALGAVGLVAISLQGDPKFSPVRR